MKPHLTFYLFATLLLTSCGDAYYTVNDYQSVPKIDTHVHLNSQSTALTELAKADNFRMLTVNVNSPSRPIGVQFGLALYHTKSSPETVDFLSTFAVENWASPEWSDKTVAHLKETFDAGALGIKIWKNIGMVEKDSAGNFIMIDDPKFDPIIQYVIDQDKTVLGHLGEPKNCWLPLEEMTVNNDRNYFKRHPEYHMYLHPEYPSYEDQINARDRFVEKHPDMRFVAAHLASLEGDVDELAKRLEKFPNMAVDMAARICHLQYQSQMDYDKVRDFMIEYQDRILYATDGGIEGNSDPEGAKKNMHETWLADWKYFVTDDVMTAPEVNGEFRGLKLPKEVIDKIFRKNAVRWFKMSETGLNAE